MSRDTALLTFGIGPVHSFIHQARRVADLWAGSYLLSHLTRQAISIPHRRSDCEMVFPHIPTENIPDGLPNRLVCRVPAAEAEAIARAMRDEILKHWEMFVGMTLRHLEELAPSDAVRLQTGRVFEISWSWVPEREGYARAALEGARQFAESRRFRLFPPSEELGEKCAICGERTALPDGNREHVHRAWRAAQARAEQEPETKLAKFLHFEQGRLCLVCATKRFFTYDEKRKSRFLAFDLFQPEVGEPYFALLKMDGDRMGSILSLGPEAVVDGDLERFHRAVSMALSRFAEGLHREESNYLNEAALPGFQSKGREKPQLLYAGGDDVLVVCDPRDALPLAIRLRERYRKVFDSARELLVGEEDRFTLSGAVLFAHPGQPAGLLLSDLEELLDVGAKERAGRDAVAIRLAKRGGPPVEVAFPWKGTWLEDLDVLIDEVSKGGLTSGQTFNLRLGEQTLQEVFTRDDQWKSWLGDRLSRSEGTEAVSLAGRIAPFFVHGRPAALRIARFLGREVGRT
ncbi:MAG TPA: type III-B CRISPR-associated protein Cas10/Cmr2 [Thermoanaerobaculia bacterium]|nr:type III-B CRISPR-associated protein Cas10/Cmr2 [Thermoanaerobaculia bacterium]